MILIVTVLVFAAADSCALASHKRVVAKSTDSSHQNADSVCVERDGNDATIVITRNRGIGSALVHLSGSWKGHLSVTFRNFSSLEKFAATNGDTCVEGSWRPGAESNGSWKIGRRELSGEQKRTSNLLNMKVDVGVIRCDVPPELLRSKRSSILRLSWIDAYRN